ncbi:MAG: peptidyl-prolyl cis-trans isomerase [Gammaproteobacteria bacterium]|nr:peptidyl-prolyl cis-trans isomerase [Gammaproteobacteria bacterium]
MIRRLLVASFLTFSLAAGTVVAAEAPATAKKTANIPLYPMVEIETSEGSFTLELNGRRAPITVKNFLHYVQNGHYVDTVFHRVIPNFMAQAGGYDKDHAEKPTADVIVNESGNGLKNYRGTIAMARFNNPHSASAQFFINLVDNDALNPNEKRWGYAVFGEVVKGMEVLDKIALIPTGSNEAFQSDYPEKTVTILKTTLVSK